jgi:ribosome-associated protein
MSRRRRIAGRWYTGAPSDSPRAAGGEGPLQGIELAHRLIDVIVDHLGADVVLLDLTAQGAFTDYFVIASIDNDRQMRAVVDALDESVSEIGESLRSEGLAGTGWVLIEVANVVVHLFSPDRRRYYDLEGLWSRAPELVHIQ